MLTPVVADCPFWA